MKYANAVFTEWKHGREFNVNSIDDQQEMIKAFVLQRILKMAEQDFKLNPNWTKPNDWSPWGFQGDQVQIEFAESKIKEATECTRKLDALLTLLFGLAIGSVNDFKDGCRRFYSFHPEISAVFAY